MNDEKVNSPALLPCPFCGCNPVVYDLLANHLRCENLRCGNYDRPINGDKFNSAYAWTLVKELAGALEGIRDEHNKNKNLVAHVNHYLAKVPEALR